MRICSKLCELLPPLLFVDASLHASNVVLLLHHILWECRYEHMEQWATLTHLLNVRSQETIQGVICAYNLNHEFELECSTHIHTIWSLAQSGFVKRFKKLVEFSFWSPCAAHAGFQLVCINIVMTCLSY